jgi:hypothetical protein
VYRNGWLVRGVEGGYFLDERRPDCVFQRFGRIQTVGDCVSLLSTSVGSVVFDQLDWLTGHAEPNRMK